MHLTVISGYELGQFLRILLWICVPGAMCALLVTTWLRYRRRQTFAEGLFLSMEGAAGEEQAMQPDYHGTGNDKVGRGEPGRAETASRELNSAEIDGVESAGGETITAGTGGFEQSKDDRVEEPGRRLADSFEEEDYKENLYKGILWMKDKYEQYRDMADQRYERLKDQLTKVERRYEDLLASLEGSRPLVGARPAEPTIRVEAGREEPILPAEPVGMEALVRMEGAPGESMLSPGPTPVMEPKAEIPEPRTLKSEAGEWNSEPREAFAEMTVVEREERTHTQELEEKLARTRQRLEEELGRVRYQLEEEIARSRRQQDEQAAVAETNRHLEQQMVHSNRQLEEKQRIIADLEVQLRSDRQKIEEMVTKLRNNSQLLMKIYQELDKSLHFNDLPKEP
jgi:hypothetical protein